MILVDPLTKLSQKLPQLSERSRERFARNAWWIALTLAIIMSLILIFSGALVFFYLRYVIANYFYTADKTHAALLVTVTFINAASFLATLAFLWASVKPLKARSLRGWNALYLALLITIVISDILISLISLVVYTFVSGPTEIKIGNIGWYLFWLFVRLYALNVLLQIRGKFSAHR